MRVGAIAFGILLLSCASDREESEDTEQAVATTEGGGSSGSSHGDGTTGTSSTGDIETTQGSSSGSSSTGEAPESRWCEHVWSGGDPGHPAIACADFDGAHLAFSEIMSSGGATVSVDDAAARSLPNSAKFVLDKRVGPDLDASLFLDRPFDPYHLSLRASAYFSTCDWSELDGIQLFEVSATSTVGALNGTFRVVVEVAPDRLLAWSERRDGTRVSLLDEELSVAQERWLEIGLTVSGSGMFLVVDAVDPFARRGDFEFETGWDPSDDINVRIGPQMRSEQATIGPCELRLDNVAVG